MESLNRSNLINTDVKVTCNFSVKFSDLPLQDFNTFFLRSIFSYLVFYKPGALLQESRLTQLFMILRKGS